MSDGPVERRPARGWRGAWRRRVAAFERFTERWAGSVLDRFIRAAPVLRDWKARRVLSRRYLGVHKRWPNLKAPRRFTEFILLRMIADTDPLLRVICDKVAAREWIARNVGADLTVPMLAVWDRPEAFDWERLPRPCVIKPSHASGATYVLRPQDPVSPERLSTLANGWLARDYADQSFERAYRGLPRRIVVEPLLQSPDGGALVELNVFVFHGDPRLIVALTGTRGSKSFCVGWFDAQGQPLDLRSVTPLLSDVLDTPGVARVQAQMRAVREQALALARTAGAFLPFVRVDFYVTADGLRIGELTPYPSGARALYRPAGWDERLGAWLRDTAHTWTGRRHARHAWPPRPRTRTLGRIHAALRAWAQRRFARFTEAALEWRGRRLRPWILRIPVLGWRMIRHEMNARAQRRGAPLRLTPPVTLNEIINHRLIHDRDRRLRTTCDKLAVRRLIAERVGRQYVVPLIGVWKRATDVPWDTLPRPVVVKPNHLSGPFCMLGVGEPVATADLIIEAESWMRSDYFKRRMEWGYSALPRRILAEPLLVSPDAGPLIEIQPFVFAGRCAVVLCVTGRKNSPQRRAEWYDREGRRLNLIGRSPSIEGVLTADEQARFRRLVQDALPAAIELAERAARGFGLMRVDFYVTDGGLRIGELTPYPAGGQGVYKPAPWDERLGAQFFDHLAAARSRGERFSRGWPPPHWGKRAT